MSQSAINPCKIHLKMMLETLSDQPSHVQSTITEEFALTLESVQNFHCLLLLGDSSCRST